jgi:hypothetical protein
MNTVVIHKLINKSLFTNATNFKMVREVWKCMTLNKGGGINWKLSLEYNITISRYFNINLKLPILCKTCTKQHSEIHYSSKGKHNECSMITRLELARYMYNGFWIVNKMFHSSYISQLHTNQTVLFNFWESVLTVVNKDAKLTTMAGMTPP